MIEQVTAQNGSQVLRADGRLLASAVDPQSEAREWCERRTSLLTSVQIVFVLGAGSGYHIVELLARTKASVVVIENDAAVVEAVQKLHLFDPQRISFVCADRAVQLRTMVHVKSGIVQSFLVLMHSPSQVGAPEFYRECRNILLGRDWANLNWQWRIRGFAPLDSQAKIHGEREPLTIYDLEQTELANNSAERERLLIKALRELVK